MENHEGGENQGSLNSQDTRKDFEHRATTLIDQMARTTSEVTKALGLPKEAEPEMTSVLYGDTVPADEKK